VVEKIIKELQGFGDPVRAKHSLRYFKTGPGEYGEGDRFIGVKAADVHRLARKYHDISVRDMLSLLRSPIHESRQLALLIFVHKFARGNEKEHEMLFRLYLKNTKWINGWDLVDCSAGLIAGEYLLDKDTGILDRLAKSKSLWERRIAMIATSAFIKQKRFEIAFRIAEQLLNDEEDLIHKAAGWMLREVGKRDQAAEEKFLKKHHRTMPRTMLRYAIEKFPEPLRQAYLAKKKGA